MNFSRGSAVFAEADRFGDLVDVVIDPFTHRASYLVVDPGGDHQQNRLVPVWLVSEVDAGLRIGLPDTHVRQLQRCLESDYVRVAAKTVTNEQLNGFRSVLALPYFHDEAITSGSGETAGIALAACEIRRSSWVVGSVGRVLGTVTGFILDGETVHSIIVRSGVIGHRHNVAVPICKVEQVSSHFLMLNIDSDAFQLEPVTNVVRWAGHFVRPRELWREVLGRPTNKLWDSFDLEQLSSQPTEEAVDLAG